MWKSHSDLCWLTDAQKTFHSCEYLPVAQPEREKIILCVKRLKAQAVFFYVTIINNVHGF